jgi:sugar lactone lactonase YvrE
MRITLYGIALSLLLAGAAGAQPGFVERFKAGTAAYHDKDYARMEAEFRAALELRPAHPTATYNLAAALALRGRGEAAIETLESLADMGLVFEPEADGDFAALKESRAFAGVRRAFARNGEPRGDAERVFRLRSPTFIPEGIAYDAQRRHFYVGSVHERRIQRVLRDDSEVDFVEPEAGLWAVLGLFADRRRDLLWAATAAIPEMRDAREGELGRTAIVAHRLKSGEPVHRFVLDDGPGPHLFGDLTVLRDGTVYATDTRGGRLYALDPKAGAFRALTPPGALSSPQGLVPSRDGRHLYVADYTQGLYRYTLDGGALERLDVARGISVYGIDGLYRHGDDLIAIQNGTRPHRVARLSLGDRGRRVRALRVLAANLEAFDEPTLGVVVDDDFYFVANSQWNRFDKDHRLPPPDRLLRPQILRIRLEGAPQREPFAPEPAPPPAPGPALPAPCVPPLC